MLEWLRENAEVVSALAAVGMLVIWLAYLQLIYASIRDQRRPRLLIHQAGGVDLDDRCIVANMSPATVYVAAVLVDVECGDERVTYLPSQPDVHQGDRASRPLDRTRQGLLGSGAYLDLGTFASLVDAAREQMRSRVADCRAVLTVRVAGLISAELFPAAATRSFEVVDEDGDRALAAPLSTLPTELSWRQQRHVAQAWLEEALRVDRERIAPPR